MMRLCLHKSEINLRNGIHDGACHACFQIYVVAICLFFFFLYVA